MKEKIISYVSSGLGPAVATFSMDGLMQKTTQIFNWLGVLFGTMLTFVMLVYWIKKIFKKEKKA